MKISLPLIRPVTAGTCLLLIFFLSSQAFASGPRAGLAVGLTAQSGTGGEVVLNPTHPDRYVVKRGDTLWDISAMFLRDPWYWPEIWRVNPQVENPHLIYPGDVLVLVYIDGKPQIRLERAGGAEKLSPRIRSEDLDEAITAIPLETIAAFLSKGTVLERDEIDNLPYIVAMKEGHMIGGAGLDVYVRGDDIGEIGRGYSVVHVGDPIVDPDDNNVVGYAGIFVGEGLIARTGDPSTLHLVDTKREALEGDRLIEQDFDIPLQFFPRAPEQEVSGRIIHVIGGLAIIGQYHIVVLNRGAKDGLEVGNVLGVWQAGENYRDYTAGGKVRLPDEHAGTLMVFKTYERISYALIMEATTDIRIYDKVKNPNGKNPNGDPLPPGDGRQADQVIRQNDCSRSGDQYRPGQGYGPGRSKSKEKCTD